MITIEQLKVLPPETEIVITEPKDDFRWNYLDMAYLKGKVLTVAGLTLDSDEDFISIPRKEPVGCSWYLQPEWLSLKEEDRLGRLKRTISALRSMKRTKYKTEHDYNRLRQITQAKYDRIKYRARCEGADTVSNDNQFIYNGFLYQQDYPTRTKTNGLVSQYFVSQYRHSTCCMRTRLPKTPLKDVLTLGGKPTTVVRRKLLDLPEINSEDPIIIDCGKDTDIKLTPAGTSPWVIQAANTNLSITQEDDGVDAKGTTLEEDCKSTISFRKSTISFPKITMSPLKGVDTKLISKLSERINSFTIEDDSEGDAVKSDGGKSSYYHKQVPRWLLDKINDTGILEIEDIMELYFDNSFNYCNVLKAQARMYSLEQGKGKQGSTFEYDNKKCHYYLDKQLERFSR